MKKLTYKELRTLWFDFWREREHAIIASSSVVPENDASVLFTNSGMHPLVPFLMGEPHPSGKRVANIQMCIRTGDIDEVGNATHLTCFEMMGNWSMGDYFKYEKVRWSYEFLTDKKYLGIDPERIFTTCFEGDEVAPRDTESAKHWEACGIPKERIFFLPKSENWWQLPSGTGPCGPCSEMFMELKSGACGPECNPSCSCGRFVEIGNDVYMEFIIHAKDEKPVKAKQQNVDTGMGLERILCLSQGKKSVYETEIFAPAIEIIKNSAKLKELDGQNLFMARRIAEHVRAASVIIGDDVIPSNSGQGYVLRRLIRTTLRAAKSFDVWDNDAFIQLINFYVDFLGEFYSQLMQKREHIIKTFMDEVSKFEKTLSTGLREFEKVVKFLQGKELSGKTGFRLYETYGFPIELTTELCAEKGITINMDEYHQAREKHSKASQTAAVGAFKGGLADTSGMTTKLHTATHLLHSALREVFTTDLHQKGSNITPERLRFDFNLDHKMTPDEIKAVEDLVNQWISQKLDVGIKEVSLDDAKKMGAIGIFNNKYGDIVKIFTIGDISCEFCGGPHVSNTSELGSFKIQKEEAVSAGIRRIKAILG
ncbi:MAG: alanine--tRNA ligase [Firmicutes bacterium]|nr:alanine--tRNA ligase [Bacillota bacterium]